MDFESKKVGDKPDHIAPDGSEIRGLLNVRAGGLAHCTLEVGRTSQAVAHKTIVEIWYFIEGEGEVWRKQGEREETISVVAGQCLTIPTGTHFQFRNLGSVPLRFVIATMPPWPGKDEAYEVENHWLT